MSKTVARVVAWCALLVALAVTLAFQYRTPGFLPGHHGYLTPMGLAMAKNLSPESRFLLFTRQYLDEQGREQFAPHNRFPLGSYALIRCALSPFKGNLAAQILAGHQLMNLFFWGALVLSYLLVLRLSDRPVLAASCALISFSSFYMQYYNDMIFNDIPVFFGFLLILLGIVRWEREGTRKLLYAAVLVAGALGWQGFGALACWWVLELIRLMSEAGMRPGRVARGLLQHQATKALAVAALWGSTLLAFNLVNEWRATGLKFRELPSVASIEFRLGLRGGAEAFPYYPQLRYRAFLETQARRVIKATVPTRALHGYLNEIGSVTNSREGARLVGMVLIPLGLVAYFGWRLFRSSRSRFSLLVVSLSGFFWTIPMRHFTAFHDFQSLFYVGFVLMVYYALLCRLPEKGQLAALALALGVYAYSSIDLNAEKNRLAEESSVYTPDFQAIDHLIGKGRRVMLGADPSEFAPEAIIMEFYMSGSIYSDVKRAEYVISKDRNYGPLLLTPGNKKAFLFKNPLPSSP